jgi:hypothetical protein
VADGTSDQAEINAALTAASGGKVYLAEGTYYLSDSINMPSTSELIGSTNSGASGNGTVLQFVSLGGLNRTMITRGGIQYPNSIIIRDLKLNGRKDLNTTGTQHGIGDNTYGAMGGTNVRIDNVRAESFSGTGFLTQPGGGSSENLVVSNSVAYNNTAGGLRVMFRTLIRAVSMYIKALLALVIHTQTT